MGLAKKGGIIMDYGYQRIIDKSFEVGTDLTKLSKLKI